VVFESYCQFIATLLGILLRSNQLKLFFASICR